MQTNSLEKSWMPRSFIKFYSTLVSIHADGTRTRRRFQFQFSSLLNILLKKKKKNSKEIKNSSKKMLNKRLLFLSSKYTHAHTWHNDNLFINYLNTQTPHVRPIFSFKYPNNLSPSEQHSSYGIRTHRYS